VAGVGAATPDAAPGAGVDPPTLELTLGPGQSATVSKRVTTPAVAPKPDIVILGDTTGSMDPVVANVRNNIDTIMDRVRESQPDARFGVTAYKDQVDGDKVFTVFTPLTDDAGAVRAGMDNMSHDVFGGGAPWTDFIDAQFRIATDALAFRPNGSRMILWFGDAAATIADRRGTGTIVDNDPGAGRGGVLTCTATAFNLSGPVANPANLPCRDDARSLAGGGLNLGLLSIRVSTLTAGTAQQPDDLSAPPADGDNATARAGLSSARINALGLVSIEVGMISSTAEARCVAGPGELVPRLAGSSSVAGLRVNGVPVPVGSGPLRIPLVIGTLELNTTVTTANSVTQRAFALTTLFGKVVIGEAKAGVQDSPCRQA